uniref:RRM domain-containing protein n=1 Tax=Ciona savignyi TaxID=51511 RepID=H2YAM5_CIOSA
MYTTSWHKKQTVPDARLKLQAKTVDARLKLRKQHDKDKPIFDARQAIKAKKIPTPKAAPAPRPRKPVTAPETHAPKSRQPVKFTTRTIRNPGAVVPLENQTLGKKLSLKSMPCGFISVTNGSRVMMEKVTMDDSGLKVAIRNDIMKNKTPQNKKSRENSVKVDKGIKITMKNPDAKKKSYSKPTKTNIQRKLPKKRSLPPPIPEPDEEEIPIITHESPPPRKRKPVSPAGIMYSDAITYPKRSYVEDGPRPMNSSVNKHFFHQFQERTRLFEPLIPHIPEQIEYFPEYDVASPFEGTKILVSNLHPIVVEDDILELFSVLGPVRRARLIGPGKAEVVFVRRDDAILAYQKYNDRDLDGQPMQMQLVLQERNMSTTQYSWMADITPRRTTAGADVTELDPNILQKALFKGGSTSTSARPVVFTVKI